MKTSIVLIFVFALGLGCSLALAQNTVLITPVGSHSGEFCRNDRALIFEDPDDLRILYDPGRTVMGSADTRLGDIDVMLLSHVHSDHLGDRVPNALDAGDCGAPDAPVSTTPNSNFAEIAAVKNATVYVGGEMHTFLGGKIAAEGGNAAQAQVLRPGAKRTIGGGHFRHRARAAQQWCVRRVSFKPAS